MLLYWVAVCKYISFVYKLNSIIMVKVILMCMVCFFCFHESSSQDNEPIELKEVKAGSAFFKLGLGRFSKLGRIDNGLTPEMEELAKKLRSGFVFTVDGGVMISSSSYIGATFSRTGRSGSFNNIIFLPRGNFTSFKVDVDEKVQYLGAYYGNMQALNRSKSIFWHSRAGVGFWNYQSQITTPGIAAIDIKESNIGFQLGTGLEVRLANFVSWVVDVDLLSGNVKVDGEKENLSQIRGSSGLLFRF
jgi:hypothetical protein